MHLTRPLVAALLTTAALSGVAAGCGDDDATTGNTAANSTPSTTAVAPSTDAAAVDRAFVRQMIPHHMMAVMMAKIAQDKAEHTELSDLADAVIDTQTSEISELEAIAKRLDVETHGMGGDGSMHDGNMADDAKTLGLTVDQMGMSMDMSALRTADPFDRAFIDDMTPHHEGAIAMAKAQLAAGQDADLRQLSTAIVRAQAAEIADMAKWRLDWYGAATGSTPASSGANGANDAGHMGDMDEMHDGH